MQEFIFEIYVGTGQQGQIVHYNSVGQDMCTCVVFVEAAGDGEAQNHSRRVGGKGMLPPLFQSWL